VLGNAKDKRPLTEMDRIFLSVTFASVVLLVTALAHMGPPLDNQSKVLAAALVEAQQ
jgi:hypothetical protein